MYTKQKTTVRVDEDETEENLEESLDRDIVCQQNYSISILKSYRGGSEKSRGIIVGKERIKATEYADARSVSGTRKRIKFTVL